MAAVGFMAAAVEASTAELASAAVASTAAAWRRCAPRLPWRARRRSSRRLRVSRRICLRILSGLLRLWRFLRLPARYAYAYAYGDDGYDYGYDGYYDDGCAGVGSAFLPL
jgi:hypothetical protein